MTAAGATVSVASVDVGDADALGAFLAERRAAGPPLRGVIHAAGVIDDAALASQDWPRFERVLRPKVGGARNLDRLTRADPLDWFVMFSSAASLLGSPGQANYAAANTMLDVIAHERRRLGRPALSVDWGPWGQVGLAASQSMKERLAATGLMPFTTQEALGALETVMGLDAAQVGVVAADWTKFFERRAQNASPSPYFAKVAAPKARTETSGAERKPIVPLRDILEGAAPGRRRALVRNFVRETSLQGPRVNRSQWPGRWDAAFRSRTGFPACGRIAQCSWKISWNGPVRDVAIRSSDDRSSERISMERNA